MDQEPKQADWPTKKDTTNRNISYFGYMAKRIGMLNNIFELSDHFVEWNAASNKWITSNYYFSQAFRFDRVSQSQGKKSFRYANILILIVHRSSWISKKKIIIFFIDWSRLCAYFFVVVFFRCRFNGNQKLWIHTLHQVSQDISSCGWGFGWSIHTLRTHNKPKWKNKR